MPGYHEETYNIQAPRYLCEEPHEPMNVRETLVTFMTESEALIQAEMNAIEGLISDRELKTPFTEPFDCDTQILHPGPWGDYRGAK